MDGVSFGCVTAEFFLFCTGRGHWPINAVPEPKFTAMEFEAMV